METPIKTTEQPENSTFHFNYRQGGVNYTVNVKARNLNEALVSFAQAIEGVEEVYKVVQKTDTAA